jgi:hypothetical protein
MPDRDLEKTIQQLKDALPKISERVKEFSDITDKMGSGFGIIASKEDALADFIREFSERQEQEEFYQMIADLIAKIDKKFAGEKMSKEMQTIRKAYELHLITTKKNISKIKQYMKGVSKEKLPAPMKKFANDLFTSMKSFLDPTKTKIAYGWDISISGGMYIFLHWIKIEGRVDKIPEKIYIVISQPASAEQKIFGHTKCSFFKDRIPKPPFEVPSKTWFVANSPPISQELKNPKAANQEITKKRIISLMDYNGMDDWLKNRPGGKKGSAKPFAPTQKTLNIFRNAARNWLLKMHPANGKGPILSFLIRRENIEKWDETGNNLIPNTISDVKKKAILRDVMLLMPKNRKLDMDIVELTNKNIDDPTKHDPYAYKLTVRFYEPGILQYK